MKLTLEALQVLDAVDKRGSFAGAANELNRVPSAITYTVRKLEDDLDVLLFERGGRVAKLTAAGRELLASGRRLLQAIDDTEKRVQRVASGWETELRIALDTIFPVAALHPLIDEFHRAGHQTRLRFSNEVLAGSWEAIKYDRADLVIGAPGWVAIANEIKTHKLGELRMSFVCAPSHPLAKAQEPLTEEQLLPHRVIAVADSSRLLAPLTIGIQQGQQVLTVPDMQAKLDAQLAGIGVGFLPFAWVATHLAAGRLIEKQVQPARAPSPIYLLMPKQLHGKAIKWWVDALSNSECLQYWLR
jgi:DNA-binding transcriptional LysR family regulator